MAKGTERFKSMNRETILSIMSTVKNSDPRVLEKVFRAQGLQMTAQDIENLSEFLTAERIEQLAAPKPVRTVHKQDKRLFYAVTLALSLPVAYFLNYIIS